MKTDNCRYVLGSVLNHVVLHQSIIGLETKLGLDRSGVQPDIVIGCAGWRFEPWRVDYAVYGR